MCLIVEKLYYLYYRIRVIPLNSVRRNNFGPLLFSRHPIIFCMTPYLLQQLGNHLTIKMSILPPPLYNFSLHWLFSVNPHPPQFTTPPSTIFNGLSQSSYAVWVKIKLGVYEYSYRIRYLWRIQISTAQEKVFNRPCKRELEGIYKLYYRTMQSVFYIVLYWFSIIKKHIIF